MVSKTKGREFESYHPCKEREMNKIVSYIKDSFNEVIHNVAWPSFVSLQESTVLVIVGSLVFGLLIFGMDTAYGWLSNIVYK